MAEIEKTWSSNGKLAELKTDWFKASEKGCWDDFLHEIIMSEIKSVYANELKIVLAGNDYESQEEAKNIAAFATISFYEQNQELEELKEVEYLEYVAEYLPKVVGESQPISFSQTNQNINNFISDKESNVG
ncbi:MAG: hypothetical protein FD167_6274, partial [bacterium]